MKTVAASIPGYTYGTTAARSFRGEVERASRDMGFSVLGAVEGQPCWEIFSVEWRNKLAARGAGNRENCWAI